MTKALGLVLFASLALGCDRNKTPKPEASADASSADAPSVVTHNSLTRSAFNELAVQAAEPVFWVEDRNADKELDPAELAVYAAYGKHPKLRDYVKDGAFTPAFDSLYSKLAALKASRDARLGKADAADAARERAVVDELAQGRVSLVATDFSKEDPALKKSIAAILRAAAVAERLYQKQMGVAALVPADEEASRALLWRNQSPRCTAPKTANDPNCRATKQPPPAVETGLYPASLTAQKDFCQSVLAKSTDKTLLDPFTVVVEAAPEVGVIDAGAAQAAAAKPESYKAVPYHVHYAEDLTEMAKALDEAAEALPANEAALGTYLRAAAKASRDGSWFEADEAWAKMSATNSKLYLRIGPDEVYAEPCSTKALFHTSFARINQASLALQQKLDAQKGAMEIALAALAGPPYKARTVSFTLPDFIDVALNAGDARPPSGATIGQSLPNFGPVANEGRGRTVAMTNFYQDADNVASAKAAAESLLCPATLARYTTSPAPQLLSTVLHEAAHNLGPSHQYKAGGKIDREAFGGPLASTLEELKAQSAALYLTDWLKEKGEITEQEADQAHVRDLTWAFGHISRGMTDENGHPRNYSQLAAVQLGSLMAANAVLWRESEEAANGTDKGCFELDATQFPAAAKSIAQRVLVIKAKGDKSAADAWLEKHVADTSPDMKLHAIIRERLLRNPKASFVYAVDLGH